MAAESSEKKKNGLQILLVVLVLVSMGLNVYLFRYYAEQDDGVEVMTFWEAANTQMHDELASIKATLVELETRQSAQESATSEILALLESDLWVEEFSSITETLNQLEARQMAQESAPAWVDKESWEAANTQMHDELASIKAMLELILTENEEEPEPESNPIPAIVPDLALNQDQEIESDASIHVMAPASVASEVTYVEDAQYPKDAEERSCPIVEVKLLPGDNVWSIVARFKPSPSPALVGKVVEFNGITDPRRLPVGFPVRIPVELVNGDLVP